MQDELYIRVKQALTWLKRNKGILQKDIADSMGMAEASFTRGLARIKEKRDEDFVIKFHSAVSEYISLDYLLNGIGDLVVGNGISSNHTPAEPTARIPDMSSVFNSALAKADETIESLKRELGTKDELIQSLRDQLASKDQIIAEQKARLIDYRHIIDSRDGIEKYPFPIGAAEPNQQSKRK